MKNLRLSEVSGPGRTARAGLESPEWIQKVKNGRVASSGPWKTDIYFGFWLFRSRTERETGLAWFGFRFWISMDFSLSPSQISSFVASHKFLQLGKRKISLWGAVWHKFQATVSTDFWRRRQLTGEPRHPVSVGPRQSVLLLLSIIFCIKFMLSYFLFIYFANKFC